MAVDHRRADLMARREITVVIDEDGRDKGKCFLIRELPAMQAEAWATRLLLCLARSGIDVPPDIMSRGMAGIASVGVAAIGGLRWEDAKPLLEEMMSCVLILPDPAHPQLSRVLIESDIEEISTVLKLRSEVIQVHTGFSLAERFSNLTGETPAAPKPILPNTKTFRQR